MAFTFYQLIFIILAYSFIGWVAETVAADLVYHRFVNRGFLNGPVCLIYGISAALMGIVFWELKDYTLYLFIGCAGLATIIQWFLGKTLEKLRKHRWWDYSGYRFNIDGYVCLRFSVLWGVLGTVSVKWLNGLLLDLLGLFPHFIVKVVMIVLVCILVVDMVTSVSASLYGEHKNVEDNDAGNLIHSGIINVTYRLGHFIVDRVERRVTGAYPKLNEERIEAGAEEGFASGCNFYKLFLLFVTGAFLGDIVETLFCRYTAGVWMSRSSVVWGPFSIVWGLAIALVSWMLYQYRNRSDRFLFLTGTLLGGAYEYLCSVFTELVFGKVFWDYSKIPFNLGGRINLLYCFFWGFAAVVWFKAFLPKTEKLIEMLPVKAGKVIVWLLVVFMSCNIAVSCMALVRYDERSKGVEAVSEWQKWSDTHYDDVRLQKIYPNAIVPK